MGREAKWDEVLNKLSPAPMGEGMYLFQDGCTDTYTKWNWEHPAIVGALGVQPGDGIDREAMRKSLRKVMEVWEWDRAWGWDFGNVAMCAARTGQPELAVKALMAESVKNRYLPNGHNYQRENLPAYLPGNGALLRAVAMMCGGSKKGSAAGFPNDGQWRVRNEGFTI